MPRSDSSFTRTLTLWALAGAGLALLAVLLRPLAPDPYASFFYKAQQLEARGLTDLALKHYRLLSEHHPDSAFAPAALEAQAKILTGMGRKSGDHALLQEAVTLYRRLADTYANDPASGKALLAAGDIAANDLRDRATARDVFDEVLARFPNNGAYASQATVKLGRLALEEGKKDAARDLLQQVLQHYPTFAEACAEAQYHLGVLFETLFKNKTWAENAYRATIERYAQSVWAANARERLGLLIYQMNAGSHPARLVLIETQPLPDDNPAHGPFARGTMVAALRPILAARGLDADVTTLQGWSLEPFLATFDPAKPSHVAGSPLSVFNNVAACAGLLYDRQQSDTANAASATLQKELDAARPVVVYNGQWQLVVGYDSEHQDVLVQSRGARVQAVGLKQFQESWKRKAPDGGAFTMMSFYAPGERGRVRRLPEGAADEEVRRIAHDEARLVVGPATTPQPTSTPLPNAAPPLGLRPAFVFDLKPLATVDAHRRALRRAASLMRRARDGDVLLNLEALDALAGELERLSAPGAAPPAGAPGGASPLPQPEGEAGVPPEGEAVPTATPVVAAISPEEAGNAAKQLARAQALHGWFGAPLQYWIGARRDAAAYLDVASDALRRPPLARAAEDLRAAIAALERAAAALPPSQEMGANGALTPAARRALAEAARQIRQAREAEQRATEAMQGV